MPTSACRWSTDDRRDLPAGRPARPAARRPALPGGPGARRPARLRLPARRLEPAVPRPAVDRMEYLLELRHPNDGRETITDPANPLRAAGAFGDKSVIEFPGYQRTGLAGPSPAAAGERSPSSRSSSRHLGSTVHGAAVDPGRADPASRRRCWWRTTGRSTPGWPALTQFVAALIARRPDRPAPGRAAGPGRSQPLVRGQPGLRPGAGRRGAAGPGRARAQHRADRRRRQPRRRWPCCTRTGQLPELLRRAVPAVRQLLPARPWTPRSAGSHGSGRSPGSSPRWPRRSPTRGPCRSR